MHWKVNGPWIAHRKEWRIQETEKIMKKDISQAERLALLAEVLDQELLLIQKLDRLKIEKTEFYKDSDSLKMADKMASSVVWNVKGQHIDRVEVNNHETMRARQLRDVYQRLLTKTEIPENRIQTLLIVKRTVREYDCVLSREILHLADRETDLLTRGRPFSSLEGLQTRLNNLFRQFLLVPDFNPIARHYNKVFI
jgi:hypothetical protein